MPAYHQMGHDSQNLLGSMVDYVGAILSPVNETEAEAQAMVAQHAASDFEFIFDPQLYYPRRVDRGKLGSWGYFPRDFDTADVSSVPWWTKILERVADTAAKLGAASMCSPAVLGGGRLLGDGYYLAMRQQADRLVDICEGTKLRTFLTLLVRIDELTEPARALEIASIASQTRASGVYLSFISDVKPRAEIRDADALKGGMRLIHALEGAGLPVLVGCASSDVVLWKAAGATSCATGKHANLRRFSPSRFSDQEEGGRQKAYWFEEELLAFVRTSDLVRIRPHGIATESSASANVYGREILKQLDEQPSKPWLGAGWRQYLQWFSDIEARLASGDADARDLVASAEKHWATLEAADALMEERENDGGWLRPWLRALVEHRKEARAV